MSKSRAAHIRHDVEEALEDVARSLTNAAADLTGDAKAVVGRAAADVARAAESVRKRSLATTRSAARKAAHEVQEHPVVSLAGAVFAGAALLALIAAMRRRVD